MRGLNERALLAQANATRIAFPEKAEAMSGEAMRQAKKLGFRDYGKSEHLLPILFKDSSLLTQEWREGYLEGLRFAAQYEGENLTLLIQIAEESAASGAGQSDTLYEARVQGAYERILHNAPESKRTETETALRARGYAPDFEPYQSKDGECSLTGIDEHCCPCGLHE